MRILWSPLSIEKISDISQYIANDNLPAAEKWVDSIFSAVKRLSDFPDSGRIVHEFRRPDLREIIHGNYRIYEAQTLLFEVLRFSSGLTLR